MTLAVAAFGPNIGPYVVITLGALGGGLWAIKASPSMTRMQGIGLMVRCVITAIVLTALIASVLGGYLKFAEQELYSVVSFAIGALGHRWNDIFESIKARLQNVISTGGRP